MVQGGAQRSALRGEEKWRAWYPLSIYAWNFYTGHFVTCSRCGKLWPRPWSLTANLKVNPWIRVLCLMLKGSQLPSQVHWGHECIRDFTVSSFSTTTPWRLLLNRGCILRQTTISRVYVWCHYFIMRYNYRQTVDTSPYFFLFPASLPVRQKKDWGRLAILSNSIIIIIIIIAHWCMSDP